MLCNNLLNELNAKHQALPSDIVQLLQDIVPVGLRFAADHEAKGGIPQQLMESPAVWQRTIQTYAIG